MAVSCRKKCGGHTHPSSGRHEPQRGAGAAVLQLRLSRLREPAARRRHQPQPHRVGESLNPAITIATCSQTPDRRGIVKLVCDYHATCTARSQRALQSCFLASTSTFKCSESTPLLSGDTPFPNRSVSAVLAFTRCRELHLCGVDLQGCIPGGLWSMGCPLRGAGQHQRASPGACALGRCSGNGRRCFIR